ncbi:MAG: hypothetical protein IJQ93_13995 [Bacteroidales bacterium]|nr:hypothetical protein [Bacteroidales bacterium]MBR0301410.1 hypothetical protein [Bacteroidales bacterium]
MSKITFGKAIEYKVVSEMMREGFEVYLPTADDHGVDLIARTINGNIVEVQIKALSKSTKGGLFAAINHTPCPKNNFYFVFYLESQNKTWIMSSSDFKKYASQNITGKNKGKYSIDVLSKACATFCVSNYHTII